MFISLICLFCEKFCVSILVEREIKRNFHFVSFRVLKVSHDSLHLLCFKYELTQSDFIFMS